MARLSSDRSFIHAVVKACDDDIIAGLIFNRIDWSVDHHRTHNETRFFFKGHWWMYDTIPDFLVALPYCSERTMKKSFAKLKDKNLILHCRVRSKDWNQTNFYSINYEEFKKLTGNNCTLAPSRIYYFEALEKLRFLFCTLAHCEEMAGKAKVQNLPDQWGKICPINGAEFARSSLSISPPVKSETLNLKKGGEEKPHPPSNLIQISFKDEIDTAYKELEGLWFIVDDYEYEPPEGQTRKEREEIKKRAFERIEELTGLIQRLSENEKKVPPKELITIGDTWIGPTLISYPNSKYSIDQLEKIARKAQSVMNSQHLDFDFPVLLSWVHKYATEYLKERFFKSPRSILIRDTEGNTFLDEAIEKCRNSIQRVMRKSKVKGW